MLLDELFFIGQDKRNTSNIINAGFYKKEDFVNTIFSLSGVLQTTNQQVDIEKTKSALKRELEDRFLKLLRQLCYDAIHERMCTGYTVQCMAKGIYLKELNELQQMLMQNS